MKTLTVIVSDYQEHVDFCDIVLDDKSSGEISHVVVYTKGGEALTAEIVED